jgi:mannan endo-1,4-beta-mannosidase
MIKQIVTWFALLIMQTVNLVAAKTILPIDSMATIETVALYNNLIKIQSQRAVILGQQDALRYGRSWQGEKDRSDIKDVAGSHPALLGLDFQVLTHLDSNYRKTETDKLVNAVKDMYQRGGIITFSWHMSNPINDGSYEWKENPQIAVLEMLPGGSANRKYQHYLQLMRDFLRRCTGSKGEAIPIIFRPFHEFDGDWFWWGRGHASASEFIQLWRYTVDYLKNDLDVHQLLYAFSPDCRFQSEEAYLEQYPGDDYVDILGMDNYWDFRPDGANDPIAAMKKLGIVSTIALEKNKLAALTEVGLEQITDLTWFTNVLHPILKKGPLAYCMLWRNAHDIPTHYYVPTTEHPAAHDFGVFCKSKDMILLNDLPLIYIPTKR